MEAAQSTSTGYRRFGYGEPLSAFLRAEPNGILGRLTKHSAFDVDQTQVAAWSGTIANHPISALNR